MFVFLLGLVAVCSAAPFHSTISYQINQSSYYQNEHRSSIIISDTRQFGSQVSTKVRQIGTNVQNINIHLPSKSSQAGVVDKEYVITIPLSGFAEKDIVVKAKEGLLKVQAVHNYEVGNEKNYQEVRSLPANVNVTGKWIFQDNVLKIEFPLKESAVTESPAHTEPTTHEFPTEFSDARPTEASRDSSREEIEIVTNNNLDVDVEATRGDQN